jgi:DAK2 domain fusion protein YloV
MDEAEERVNTYTRRHEIFLATPFDGQVLKKMIEVGLTWLRTNQQTVNSLNVFPVPDGDTGTNMVLTMQAAYEEIAEAPERNLGKMAHSVAHGALMGARGNSGVILSQLWRGFARSLDNRTFLDGPNLVRALAEARDTAYRGVVRPVEGTILTVAKDIASAAEETLKSTSNIITILETVVLAADASVLRTPELLEDHKKAGVVDAGGKGLFFILEGMLRYINGQPLDTAVTTVQPLAAVQLGETLENIEPGQDIEVVVDFKPGLSFDLENFYRKLEKMGTSIQVGEGDGIYRMHIHVPEVNEFEPVKYIKTLGTVMKYSVENLVAQMQDLERTAEKNRLTLTPIEPDQLAVVAISPGAGISRVFASLGAAAIVNGGQTMNPSTQEIIQAIENLPTDSIIILPNNPNIILTARAASSLTVKKIAVVPSRTVPQGLEAMLRLIPDGKLDQVAADMTRTLQDVQTGEITNATRSVEIDGVAVRVGQYIALLNEKLILSSDSLEEACLKLLAKAGAENFEIITLFYGADLPRQEVNRITDIVRTTYPDQEVEIQEGGQPYYQFIISIE